MPSGQNIKLSEEVIAQIIQEYKNKVSTRQLAKKYGFKCHKSIVKILKNNNITIRSKKESLAIDRKIFTEDEINKIYELNKDPFSTITEISRILKCDPQTIKKCLIKVNKYDENKFDDYLINKFDIIDTEEKAYWIGFLTADGCVNDKQLLIRLAEVDILHIEKFKKFFGVDYKISKTISNLNGKKFIGYEYRISSKKFVSSLYKHNLVPRKSFTTEIPNSIPNELMSHFIRGLIDGDGSLSISNNKLHFSLISSVIICEQVQNILIEKCNLNKTKLEIKKFKGGILAIIHYCGNKQVARIIKFLYSNASIYLNRKHDFLNKIS